MSENIFVKLRIINYLFDYFFKDGKHLYENIKRFEKRLSYYLEANCVMGVASGTDALILSLKAVGIGPGDEVIVPALSFFSTAGAVAWINARPVFVDVEEKSLNINPVLIGAAITPKTKAIIATHLNGRMADMEPIAQIAKRHNLFLIEDAAQAIGSKYKGKSPGYYSDIACFSFNSQKILTAGGDGGAVVTNNKDLAEKINLLRMYGAKFEEISFNHTLIGALSRLSPFHAVIMNIKMENLDSRIAKQRKNYFLYSTLLRDMEEIILPDTPNESEYSINGYRYAILLSRRDELIQHLKRSNIEARAHYSVLLPYFDAFSYLGYKKASFPVAEQVARKILILPTDDTLSEKEIKYNAEQVINFFKVI